MMRAYLKIVIFLIPTIFDTVTGEGLFYNSSLCRNWKVDKSRLIYKNAGCIRSLDMEDLRCESINNTTQLNTIHIGEFCDWEHIDFNLKEKMVECRLPEIMKRMMYECEYDKFALVLKSGKDVIFQRLYLANSTYAYKFRNQIIASDESGAIGDARIHNMYLKSLFISAQENTGLVDIPIPAMINEDGWRRDAYKFLPGIRIAYETYPNVEWYAILDDDTYIFTENLVNFFGRLNKTENAEVIGWSGLRVKPCGIRDRPTEFRFYYGGSGIFISSAAMKKLYPKIDMCMLKYAECWAGDIIISRCLTEDSGVTMNSSDNPHGFEFLQYSAVFGKGWPKKDKKCVCPITAHHMKDLEMQELYEIEKELLMRGRVVNFGNIFNKMYGRNTSLIMVEGFMIFNFSSTYEWNSPILKEEENVSDEIDCARICINERECLSFTWYSDFNKCRLKKEIGLLMLQTNVTNSNMMGVISSRYSCNKENCEEDGEL